MPNPLASLLDPGQNSPGTIFGMLGRGLGIPNQAGVARGDATATITQDIRNGKPAQQAVMDFFNSPAGHEAFASDPNIMATIKDAVALAMPQAPKAIGGPVSPGQSQRYYDPQKGTYEDVTVPTADVQTFNAMAKIADLPPDKLAELAKGRMLVNNRFEIQPIKDQWGQDTGNFVIADKMTGHTTTTNTLKSNYTKVPGVTDVPANMKKPDGSVDLPTLLQDSKATMFLGEGAYPALESFINSMVGSYIHPQLGSPQGRMATRRRAHLQQLVNAVTLFPQAAGKTNYVIKELQRLVSYGWGEEPVDSLNVAIDMYDKITNTMAANDAKIASTGTNVSPKLKDDLSKENNAWDRILKAMPSRGEMVALRDGIQHGQVPGLGAAEAYKTIKELGTNVGKAISGQLNQVTGRQEPKPGQRFRNPATGQEMEYVVTPDGRKGYRPVPKGK